MTDTITTEQIASYYTAMGHSIDVIDDVLAGNQVGRAETDEEKKGFVDRNVRHLEKMLTKDYWTSEDMTAVNAAITAGKEYIG